MDSQTPNVIEEFEKSLALKKEIILIYQMGKVGSCTVSNVLDMLEGFAAFQVHNLNYKYIEQNPGIYGAELGKIIYNKIIEKELPLKIISMARSPIERNISAYFQNLHAEKLRLDVDFLINDFLVNYFHFVPLRWFDNEFNPVTGIDIYSQPFDHIKKYDVMKKEQFQVLLWRTDLSNDLKEKVLSDFLGIENIHFEDNNVSATKKYSDKYREFVKNFHPDKEYLDKMLDSQYTRHFFSSEEIQQLYKKWENK